MNQWRWRNRLRTGRDVASRILVRTIPEPVLSYSWHNPLFDSHFYLAQYPDVARAGVHPERHYRRHGVTEGRNPNALFRTSWYLRTYADVAAARSAQPSRSLLLLWRIEGRDPSPLFRSAWYPIKEPGCARRGCESTPSLPEARDAGAPPTLAQWLSRGRFWLPRVADTQTPPRPGRDCVTRWSV